MKTASYITKIPNWEVGKIAQIREGQHTLAFWQHFDDRKIAYFGAICELNIKNWSMISLVYLTGL